MTSIDAVLATQSVTFFASPVRDQLSLFENQKSRVLEYFGDLGDNSKFPNYVGCVYCVFKTYWGSLVEELDIIDAGHPLERLSQALDIVAVRDDPHEWSFDSLARTKSWSEIRSLAKEVLVNSELAATTVTDFDFFRAISLTEFRTSEQVKRVLGNEDGAY